ncbi:MAG TPA: Cof-type HAD-IIB family hydrolase [Symbiobacteriaceae bacterium]|nr:Cof-type HAD-IIB family hydrolase [Symbiobacteriaceae bacterium]
MTGPRLLALDIDGTILTSRGEISPRVRRAVSEAMRSGMLVTLATGRNLRAALPIAEQLQISTPLVVSNGALVVSPVTGQTLSHIPLDRTVAVKAVQLLQQLGFVAFANRSAPEGPDLFYEQRPSTPEQASLLARDPAYSRQVYDLAGQVAGMEPLKVMAIDRTPAIEAVAGRLRRRLKGDFHVLVTQEGPGYSLLEVSPGGISKATGLDKLSALYAVHPAEIMAFGDNYNDVEMLQFAGIGVAMGNAPEAVKQAARVVTATNDEDGVALCLEQYAFRVA